MPSLTNFTKRERAQLRELSLMAWQRELSAELEKLYEDFGRWGDDSISAFDLSDRIHEFHNGVSRELYGRYVGIDPVVTVSRAVARGLLAESDLSSALVKKLASQIAIFRKLPEDPE